MTSSAARKNVTLADVAKAAGVSKTTASQSLSGKGFVASETRELVGRVASEMGYQIDPLAQLLSKGRCETTIGFFTLDIDLSGRTRQLQIIQAELNERGFSVPIYGYGYSGAGEVENQIALMNNLLAQRPRAIVCNLSGVHALAIERLRRYVDDGGIAVCYGYNEFAPIACDQIVHAEPDAFVAAVRHLVDLGHREIGAFDVGPRRVEGANLAALHRELRAVGGAVNAAWLFENDGTRRYEEDGARVGREFLALAARPTAMIVANDYAAAAFASVVTRAGVSIPRQLSLVGHGDDAIAPYAVVPLTTTAIAVEALARGVVQLLLERIEGELRGQPRHLRLPSHLVARESTAPAARDAKSRA